MKKPIDLPRLLYRLELRYVLKALRATKNNRTLAANLLGITRTTLVMKLRKFGLIHSMPSPMGGRR